MDFWIKKLKDDKNCQEINPKKKKKINKKMKKVKPG